jgi:hypothetical protein
LRAAALFGGEASMLANVALKNAEKGLTQSRGGAKTYRPAVPAGWELFFLFVSYLRRDILNGEWDAEPRRFGYIGCVLSGLSAVFSRLQFSADW